MMFTQWESRPHGGSAVLPAGLSSTLLQLPVAPDAATSAMKLARRGEDMRLLKDPVFLALAGILAILLLMFFLDVIPYPFGLLVLLAFIVARILYKS